MSPDSRCWGLKFHNLFTFLGVCAWWNCFCTSELIWKTESGSVSAMKMMIRVSSISSTVMFSRTDCRVVTCDRTDVKEWDVRLPLIVKKLSNWLEQKERDAHKIALVLPLHCGNAQHHWHVWPRLNIRQKILLILVQKSLLIFVKNSLFKNLCYRPREILKAGLKELGLFT